MKFPARWAKEGLVIPQFVSEYAAYWRPEFPTRFRHHRSTSRRAIKQRLKRVLRSERCLRECLLRIRILPQPISDHGLRHLGGVGNSFGFVVAEIRTSVRFKTLRKQGIHIFVQRSRRIRRRGLIFDYFHRLQQNRPLRVCQLLSQIVAKVRFWIGVI